MDKLKFAIPAGSLAKATSDFLARSGYKIGGTDRTYRPSINDPDIEMKVLRPQEIPVFVNVELLNILIQQIPREKWRDIGRRMGAALKVSMETTLELPAITQDHWSDVFKRLKVQGFGDIYPKDKYILAKTPFINEAEVLAGILEGLLNVPLDLKTMVPPLVFEVRRPLASNVEGATLKP